MVNENTSPEERLLNVIEKGEAGSFPKGERKIAFFDDLRVILANFKRRLFSIGINKRATKSAEPFDIVQRLNLVNRTLAALAAVLVLLLIVDILIPRHNTEKLYASASELGNWQFQKGQITLLKPLSFYEEATQKRDLFNRIVKQAPEVLIETKQMQLGELVKDLNLVGIYWSDQPEVMIEEISSKRCYFLKQGDEIKGIKLKQILKDRVILEYQGSEMEFM